MYNQELPGTSNDDWSFNVGVGTDLNIPTLTTQAISNITQTTATSGGNITDDGGSTITARGVCYSTNPNPTTTDNTTNDGAGAGTFTSNLTDLQPNTTYYVRAYATNNNGTAYGNEMQFTTSTASTIPTLSTSAISNITQTTATSGGNITDNGGNTVTARGVCYSTNPNPTTADQFTTDGTGTGSFTSNLTGLTANTTYYVRAYATNSNGTAYGNEIEFTTQSNLPIVSTTDIINITENTATGGGNVTSQGSSSVTAKGICWNTLPNPTVSNNSTNDGSGQGNFLSTLDNLAPGSTYFVRAYATNSYGTSYGNEIVFSTEINIQTGSVIDTRDGKSYNTVKIGNQWWMSENMAYSGITSYVYNDDANNEAIYGRLYSRGAISTICPNGWHIPSKSEFVQLTNYLNNSSVGWLSSVGGKLKETGTTHWNSPNTGATNVSQFSALPGGMKDQNGNYISLGEKAFFWTRTTSQGDNIQMYMDLAFDSETVHVAYWSVGYRSCRCVKD